LCLDIPLRTTSKEEWSLGRAVGRSAGWLGKRKCRTRHAQTWARCVSAGEYKLGDFGHATLLEAKQANVHVEEGDARYVARELLNHDHSNLDRADVFALGAMAYELARGTALAGNGVQYEEIRQGRLMLLPGFSASFQGLLKVYTPTHTHTRTSGTRQCASNNERTSHYYGPRRTWILCVFFEST